MKKVTVWIAGIASSFAFASSAMAANPGVGTLEFIEGEVFFNGTALGHNNAFPIMARNDNLRTGIGHAEVLLTPGVFLRMGGQASIRLTDGSLTNTSVRLDRGAAMLEVDELHQDNSIRIEVGGHMVRILKTGLYRFDVGAGVVQVLEGRVGVEAGVRYLEAGKHRQVNLNADARPVGFTENRDELDRWSRLRSEYEAEANVASAQYIYDMGWGWGFRGWAWNPWFGAYTWLPGSALFVNPYGFSFFSPAVVYRVFPTRYYGLSGIHFAPGIGRVSPSGLNLQRMPAARAAATWSWAKSPAFPSNRARSFMRPPRAGVALHRR